MVIIIAHLAVECLCRSEMGPEEVGVAETLMKSPSTDWAGQSRTKRAVTEDIHQQLVTHDYGRTKANVYVLASQNYAFQIINELKTIPDQSYIWNSLKIKNKCFQSP